jgi:hypothetical protein
MRLFAAALLAAVLASLLAGCAVFPAAPPHFEGHLHSASTAERECAQWYRTLDAQIDAAGVRDAQYAQLSGFPYLRVDRPLASLRDRAGANDAAFRAFAQRLLGLDFDARRHEIENLHTGSAVERAALLRRMQECGTLLRDADLASAPSRAAILEAAQVADDYSLANRVLGLYPLSSIAFFDGVQRLEAETRAIFGSELQLPAGATLVRHAPPQLPPMNRATVAAMLARTEPDAFGPRALSEPELQRLAAQYAPSFEVAVTGDYDRFGQLRWNLGVAVPEVDPSAPVAYVQQAFTRYRDGNGADRILPQLVYTIWFSQRPPADAGDLLSGRLDGLVWRVTLAPGGEPLLYDSIHPCGCYHQFFPTPRARLRPAPDALEEWAFTPQQLPRVAPDERPLVRLASRTHYIERVSLVRGADSVEGYAFLAYDALRSLPRPQGGRRSVFGPDGLIAGTERAERFLFWPMGIRSAGAMRQWGRQATAFVGRRHFDDADLIEKRFELSFSP